MTDNKKDPKLKKKTSAYMQYSGLAFQMAAMVFLGIYGGQWLDEYFGLETPFITIFLTLILFVGFMIKLYKDLIKP